MTVRLITAYQGTPAGARVSLGWGNEERLVAQGKATYNLDGSFVWPATTDRVTLGPIGSVEQLTAAYPPQDYVGASALVGSVAPFTQYTSNGVAWANLVAELAAQRLSSYLRFWIPTDQNTGNALDLSPAAADLIPAGTMTTGELWATSGQVSFPGGTGKFSQISSAQANVDLLTQSCLFSFWYKKAAPGASEWMFGQRYLASWLTLKANSAGAGSGVVFYIIGYDGVTEEVISLPIVTGLADGSLHHVVFAWDHVTKNAWVFVDKVLASSTPVALTKSTANTKSLPIGCLHPSGAGVAGSSTVCYVVAMKDLQLYTPPSIIAAPLALIVRKLYRGAGPLQDSDFLV